MPALRPFAFALAAAALSSVLLAAPPDKEKTKTHGFSVAGVVARTDEAAHTFVVRTSAGKETSLVRTTATRLNGKALASGDHVAVRYLERDGKKIATSIRVEPSALATATATPTAVAPAAR
jgi:ribosomal protein L16/L10AE